MQCNWLSTARLTQRYCVFGQRYIIGHSVPGYTTAWLRKNICSGRSLLELDTTQHTKYSTATSLMRVSTPPTGFFYPPGHPAPPLSSLLSHESDSATSLSTAHISRAAARAIHVSIRNKALPDAYLILNSVRYASLRTDTTRENLRWIGMPLGDFEQMSIHFPHDISPRLSWHALIHGLLHLGLSKKAGNLVKQMMISGIKVRSKTLEAVTDSVSKTPFILPQGKNPVVSTAGQTSKSNCLKLHPSMAKDGGTRFALQLLDLARKHKNHRTNTIFRRLIALCIINGEIIIASLIFGLVAQNEQKKKLLAAHLTSLPEETAATNTGNNLRTQYNLMRAENLALSKDSMFSILKFIDKVLSQDGVDPSHEDSIQSSLQALANIASLLDNRLIPFGNISTLIHSLTSCPNLENEVWIMKDNKPFKMKAYQYFHEVLQRLIDTLPTKPPDQPSGAQQCFTNPSKSWMTKYDALPPLNIQAYNTLIHYALRHRLSPPLAERILNHMTEIRFEPLAPDTTTLNILLRSGSLLRHSTIVETALQGFEQYKELSVSKWEPHTLTTYITYLISSGKPEAVKDLLFIVIPEIKSLLHEITKDNLFTRKKCLDRIAKLGPQIVTSFLHGLTKAGNTGLAHKLWFWAREAEVQSQSSLEPWHLPIHAYTIMVKCFVIELPNGAPWTPVSMSDWQADGRARHMIMAIFREAKMLARPSKFRPSSFKLDGRFFNTLLDVIAPRQPANFKSQAESEAYYDTLYRKAQESYATDGTLSTLWNEDLHEVVEEMVRTGHPIPTGLKHIFVGRSIERRHLNKFHVLDRRPLPFAGRNRRRHKSSLLLHVFNNKSSVPNWTPSYCKRCVK